MKRNVSSIRYLLLLLATVTSLPLALGADPAGASPVEDEKEPPRAERRTEERREGLEDFLGRLWRRRRLREPGRYEKNYAAVRAAFREAVARASESTVLIREDDEAVALGVVVDEGGLLVSKASELEGDLECEFESGLRLPAELVWADRESDLAFLRVPAAGLKPIEWRDDSQLPVGSWVVTPGPSEDPIAIGVVSVATRKIEKVRKPSDAYLGVVTAKVDDGLVIREVMDGTSASKAELKAGDIILAVAGKIVDSPTTLFDMLQPLKPGDGIRLKVQRGKIQLEFDIELGRRPSNLRERNDRLAGALSRRRSNFPAALQHDTMLDPHQCGGPVLDVYGKAVGINIARAGRVECYAIPVDAVLPLIEEVKSGKHLTPVLASAPAIDSRLVNELEQTVAKLSDALKSERSGDGLQKDLAALSSKIEQIRGLASSAGKTISQAEAVLEAAGWKRTATGYEPSRRRRF